MKNYNVTLAAYAEGVKLEAEITDVKAETQVEAIAKAQTKTRDVLDITWVPTYVNQWKDDLT